MSVRFTEAEGAAYINNFYEFLNHMCQLAADMDGRSASGFEGIAEVLNVIVADSQNYYGSAITAEALARADESHASVFYHDAYLYYDTNYEPIVNTQKSTEDEFSDHFLSELNRVLEEEREEQEKPEPPEEPEPPEGPDETPYVAPEPEPEKKPTDDEIRKAEQDAIRKRAREQAEQARETERKYREREEEAARKRAEGGPVRRFFRKIFGR